jgi:hypothetical protein
MTLFKPIILVIFHKFFAGAFEKHCLARFHVAKARQSALGTALCSVRLIPILPKPRIWRTLAERPLGASSLQPVCFNWIVGQCRKFREPEEFAASWAEMLKSAREVIGFIEEGLAPFHFFFEPSEDQGLGTQSQVKFVRSVLPVCHCYSDKRVGTIFQLIRQATAISCLIWIELVKFYQANLANASEDFRMASWPLRGREESPEMNTVLFDQHTHFAVAQLWTLRRPFSLTSHGSKNFQTDNHNWKRDRTENFRLDVCHQTPPRRECGDAGA